MNNQPEYTIEIKTDKYVLIRDHANYYQCMSVTNGAEKVVEYLYENGILGDRKLFYIDTNDRVDELLHLQERFTGFKQGFSNLLEFNGTLANEVIAPG